MIARRSPSRSRAFLRNGASPIVSVSAVELAISAKRMTTVPEGAWAGAFAGGLATPMKSAIIAGRVAYIMSSMI